MKKMEIIISWFAIAKAICISDYPSENSCSSSKIMILGLITLEKNI